MGATPKHIEDDDWEEFLEESLSILRIKHPNEPSEEILRDKFDFELAKESELSKITSANLEKLYQMDEQKANKLKDPTAENSSILKGTRTV